MRESKQRPGVMIYFDTICPALARMRDEQCGELLKGIIEYAMTGAIPELDIITGMAFDMLRPAIDHDAERYEEIKEQRKYAAYCREANKRETPPLSFDEWQRVTSHDIK